MHVSRHEDHYWAEDQMHGKKKTNAKMLWMVENLIPCMWIRLIIFLITRLFLSLCSPPVREQDAVGIVRGGTVLPGLLFFAHFKSEVMGHFRRLLLHTPNCQYAVITKGPFPLEISIAYVHCTQNYKAALDVLRVSQWTELCDSMCFDIAALLTDRQRFCVILHPVHAGKTWSTCSHNLRFNEEKLQTHWEGNYGFLNRC